MKKNLVLFFLLLFASTSLCAQIHEPVKWEITASEIDKNDEITVAFRAVIEKGWHVYGMNLPEDGPVSTNFVFEKENAEVAGLPVSHSKSIKKYEPVFGMEVNWHENEALFTQKFKIKDKKSYSIKGHVEYMVLPSSGERKFFIWKFSSPGCYRRRKYSSYFIESVDNTNGQRRCRLLAAGYR